MAPFKHISNTKEPAEESLHIKKSARKISFWLRKLMYRDKDTRQIVVYIPSLELSGYGETEKEAEKMIRFSLDEYFKYLLALPQIKMDAELLSLGWKHNKIKTKEFSKAYVDMNGNLKDFNAVGNKVEVGVLTAK